MMNYDLYESKLPSVHKNHYCYYQNLLINKSDNNSNNTVFFSWAPDNKIIKPLMDIPSLKLYCSYRTGVLSSILAAAGPSAIRLAFKAFNKQELAKC